jgi:hypothetical protein
MSCLGCEKTRSYCHSTDLIMVLVITACEFPRFLAKFNLFEEN